MVKMLTVLVSTISNSQVFLLKKNVSSFSKCKSYSLFFSKNICLYAIFKDQSFNDKLTNDIISFEQLSPGLKIYNEEHIKNENRNHGFIETLYMTAMLFAGMYSPL